MDRRERLNSLQESILASNAGLQSGIWTALPGIIQSFNPVAMTCEVKPTIQAKITDQQGNKSWASLPLLLDCPVFFPSGGGCTLTFPIINGDECLIIFSSRCIDAWWQSGKVDIQHRARMHDLSDGFIFAGVRSQPRVLSNVSTNAVQLRTDDASAFVEIHPATHAINITTSTTVNVTATTSATVTAPTATISATTASINASGVATISSPSIILQNAGTALKKLVNDTFIAFFNSHVHSGVTVGSGSTGVPTSTPAASTTTSTVQAE